MDVYEALRAVVREASGGLADYAKSYAKAALELGGSCDAMIVANDNTGVVEVLHKPTGKPMVGDEMRVQILYVLSNLAGWRGDRAREVKAVLKAASK